MIENLTFSDLISQHIGLSMKLALSVERYPLWKRFCPELADIDFIRLGLFCCIVLRSSTVGAIFYKKLITFIMRKCL